MAYAFGGASTGFCCGRDAGRFLLGGTHVPHMGRKNFSRGGDAGRCCEDRRPTCRPPGVDRCVQRYSWKISMRLGTPLSPAAVKVMLLGSGELGKEIFIELQRLGVETVAVDRYANAPAHQVAHRAHVIDMTDARALRALVEQERPHLLVPEIEALATDELVRIEADGLCRVIPPAGPA